ncbi:threonylcarbamoyl-AMP synthase [Candidatus Gracilibacteria bacterium]|nr:threonylcarbamoyl-AMP synthase [Candidatus Gracilibacteria bacterium]
MRILEDNGVIAIPTETVYGLAGNAYSDIAVKKIFQIKGRPLYNPLIVHIKSIEYLKQVAKDIPDNAKKLAKEFWPGALTMVLSKLSHVSDIVTAGHDTVAVRIPSHPLALELLKRLDFPLAAPSANPFGSISPTSAEHVNRYFGDNLEIILDGGLCERGIESTIVGFDQDTVILYRHGSISIESLERVVGKVILKTKDDVSPTAPGMLSRHYAPSIDTYLTDNVRGYIERFSGLKIGIILFNQSLGDSRVTHEEVISPCGNLEEAARNLYSALHRLDRLGLDIIITERLPDYGLGKTINDRLGRATKK